MRVTWLQSCAFETVGNLAGVLAERGLSLEVLRLDLGAPVPKPAQTDFLIMSGGPMGVYESEDHRWIPQVLSLMRDMALCAQPVLGICLGAQLLAVAAGGSVRNNRHCEIGWHPVTSVGEARSPLAPLFATGPTVFHWHRDVIIPSDMMMVLARSAACDVQAFQWGPRALGVQFHPEMDRAKAEGFAKQPLPCPAGPYVQTVADIIGNAGLFDRQRGLARQIIESLLKEA